VGKDYSLRNRMVGEEVEVPRSEREEYTVGQDRANSIEGKKSPKGEGAKENKKNRSIAGEGFGQKSGAAFIITINVLRGEKKRMYSAQVEGRSSIYYLGKGGEKEVLLSKERSAFIWRKGRA